jgi:peptidoglycan-N-acetylglucosamine deacetylase
MRSVLAAVAVLISATSCAASISGTGSRATGSAPPPASTSSTTTTPPPATRPRSTTAPPPVVTSTPTQPAVLPARLLGQDWTRIPTTQRVVALTFDAGSNAAGVRSILATLASRHVAATFFLTGSWVQQYPGRARTIAASYRVGNHSMTHPHFTTLTAAQMRTELSRAATQIRAVCGVEAKPLFRFPYGDRDARTIRIVNAAGYLPVGWTVDTLGWKGARSGITVDSIVARVLAGAGPGEIVLMHVGANPQDRTTLDADALPQVIAKLQARGYGFVTLDALLA